MTSVARAGSAVGEAGGVRVHRIEVRPRSAAGDPLGRSVRHASESVGHRPSGVRTARVYLIEAALSGAQVERLRAALLTDPVLEESNLGALPVLAGEQLVEVHPLPGVMDPAALTVERTARELLGFVESEPLSVVTGYRYDVAGLSSAACDDLAKKLLANGVIEQVHREPFVPSAFPVHKGGAFELRHVKITTLTDAELEKLSREGHLFLSLDEMRAIRAEYQRVGREPTDIELETLAQTWSEHCVHKTLKSRITYRRHQGTEASSHRGEGTDPIVWDGRPGHTVNADGSVTIDNLLKSTVAAATFELIGEGVDWTLSVFKDNAGVIAFDETHAVCVKVETHNHPSAIEPYGGSATGVGGCIRDVMGTGLGAKPIANTDVFCVAMPDIADVPSGCLHPRRVLTRVIDGVRDYGNRMGIPTLNGAVYFDDRYIGNPLVFCGCVGVMPRDMIKGQARAGDIIVALGGRTGRDGIHGATFSSAELTDTHADEFSHAVQIGNAIEEKRTLDAILRARDYGKASSHRGIKPSSEESGRDDVSEPSARCLFSAITDCGAGGFSSAVGEMGSEVGATVFLERAPLKYQGLRYDEIWISESQERMVLAVPPGNIEALRAICREESVEMCELGVFGPPTGTKSDEPQLVLNYRGTEVGRLSMHFLHDGIPMPTREAVWRPQKKLEARSLGLGAGGAGARATTDVRSTLLSLLAHPNIASKKWIVRQYDHEVQGNTVVKPLVGPGGIGPGDAAVIQPVPGSKKGLAIGCGLATPLGDPELGGDPYLMALAAVDECVRNLVCVGADPERIAILDNFCWPSCGDPKNLASLVRAAEGCYDAAKAYRTPFVSGKDSLNNQFRTEDGKLIEIPPTLLISGIGIVPDVARCVTMDLKVDAKRLFVVRPAHGTNMWSAHGSAVRGDWPAASPTPVDLEVGPRCAWLVAQLISRGAAAAVHDASEGGPLVAIAEMLIAASATGNELGVEVDAPSFVDFDGEKHVALEALFAEQPSTYIVQARDESRFYEALEELNETYSWFDWHPLVIDIGWVDRSGSLSLIGIQESDRFEVPVTKLKEAFLGTLDW